MLGPGTGALCFPQHAMHLGPTSDRGPGSRSIFLVLTLLLTGPWADSGFLMLGILALREGGSRL